MAGISFEWRQPVGGKTLVWRPLKVGDQMDLDGNYARSDVAYLKTYAAYAHRVVQFDGKPGFQVNDFREWDGADLDGFVEEVQLRELSRAMQIQGQSGSSSPVQRLEMAIKEAQIAASKLSECLKAVLVSAKSAEAVGPLAQAGSGT